MKIVILTGRAGVGKDTYARKLRFQLDGFTETIAYADYLKYVAKNCGWNGVKDLAGRTLLQDLGEVVNEYDRTTGKIPFWTNIVVQKIKQEYHVDTWIITDARHDYEVTELKRLLPDADIEVVELIREYKTSLTQEQQGHVSETPLNPELIDRKVVLDENN
jgi:hypothetical protein